MATALATQLAAIAANSTNQLDLKAQRRAHSQSLIFEPHDAARQDFDTIYDVCVEGFRELCLLDPRLRSFSRSLFSDHSKDQDRTQMTSAQNEELDVVLERFLHLVGSKVLLQPTIKAIEWLVRRFRVHEYNTLCLILTFLPYHTLPVFTTLLSIVPKKLSPATKFLHPYIESLASPPRHVIAYAATNNAAFFMAWNNYVLKSCRDKSFSPTMIAYWATTMTEAVTGQLDQIASVRREAQRQREEDILLRILPVLSKGLSMKSVPDVRVGCYMILSVLASRTNLDDRVLVGLVEAVLSGGTKETSHAELICVAVLVQQRAGSDLPLPVFEKFMSINSLVDDLVAMSERYQVSNLALSLASGLVQRTESGELPGHQNLIHVCIQNHLLTDQQSSALVIKMISVAGAIRASSSEYRASMVYLANVMKDLLASESTRPTVHNALEKKNMKLGEIESLFRTKLLPSDAANTMAMEDLESRMPVADLVEASYRSLKAVIPAQIDSESSLLCDSNLHLFDQLAATFVSASKERADVDDFMKFLAFQESKVAKKVLSLTFFTRFWCSSFPSPMKAAACSHFSESLEAGGTRLDVQYVVPYIFCALSDQSGNVRSTAIQTLLYVAGHCRPSEKATIAPILGKDNLYGPGKTTNVSWLSPQDLTTLLNEVLLPNLEECALDPSHIFKVLRDTLQKTLKVSSANDNSKARKSSFRASVLRFITSHAIETPLYSVRHTWLRMLEGVSKAGGVSKTQALLPLLSAHMEEKESDFTQRCKQDHLDHWQYARRLVKIVSPSDLEANQFLQKYLSGNNFEPSQPLETALFQHVRDSWDMMKPDIESSWASILFNMGILKSSEPNDRGRAESAHETLMNVALSVDSIIDCLDQLPRMTVDTDRQSPSLKRRKTSNGVVENRLHLDEKELSNRLRQSTTVLELIEGAKHGNNARLLFPLFQILHDLQRCSSSLGNRVSYPQSVLLRSMTRIIEHSRSPGASPVEHQSIRVDMVIDCFRNTSSLQVQQEGLRLLSNLALLAPNLIVHRIMPIFTFMGNSVLRQNDELSARIVDSTIESVIPPLISSFPKRKEGLLGGAAELILSFAAAFEHIPVHRRLELLGALMKKLGEEDYLYVLFVVLVDRHSGKSTVLEFCTSMMSQYGSVTQLKTIRNCLDVATDSLLGEPHVSRQILSSDPRRKREETTALLIDLSSNLLKGSHLSNKVAKILKINNDGAEEIRSIYSDMVEGALRLSNETKPIDSLRSPCDSILNTLLDFLPLSDSLTSLNPLLEQENGSLRRQVLKSFEQRISAAKPGDVATESACFQLLPPLLCLLVEIQDLTLKRIAIAIVDRVVDKYGRRNTSAVTEAASVVAGDKCLGSDDPQMQVLALLCLITLVEVLREAIIPVIPSILPRSLDLLQYSIDGNGQRAFLHNTVFRFFDALLLYVPWIVTGDHLLRFLKLSSHSASLDMSDDDELVRSNTLDLVGKQLDPHECIEALHQSWNEAVSKGVGPVSEHLGILEKVIDCQPKSVVVKESHSITRHFLGVMDLRRSQELAPESTSWTTQQMRQVQEMGNKIIVKMIYKLNDTHFRPLFVKMSEWSTELHGKKERKARSCRQISWFSFLQHFFNTLESLVTGYASYIVDEAVDILASYNPSQPYAHSLRERVLKTLHAMFEHDQDEFWRSPSRFDAIYPPLLSQFEHASGKEGDSTLVACITSFATAADSPDHLKALNSKILGYLRSDSVKVRLAAIRCELSLTEDLGEEWLNLLPEMLPAISEAMEDDDERIESEVRTWARKIEDILGENLDAMLQ